uniref:Uncharacterized protein n=1 Tax=Tanacetum cinerariifolium TaxID=118510 RepID=A0A699GJ58_TANCI|nr:hypothetical protein [Tanacetum cinerariifolium]
MSSSAIPVSTDSTEESVGLSASLIILFDFDSEAPPSPVHHAIVDPEFDLSKDDFKEDPLEDDLSEAAGPLSAQDIPPPDPNEATIA